MLNRRSNEKEEQHGWSDVQRAMVAEELDFILGHPAFKGSKRCVELLRYLVRHAEPGSEDGFKERALGIEVFGRNPNYDVNSDPIVRRTANEIRKRLAQCYQEADRPHEVKIGLERGGYLPHIEFASENGCQESAPTEKSPVLLEQIKPQEHVVESSATGFGAFLRVLRGNWILGVVVVVLLIAGGILGARYQALRSPEFRVWKPLLDSGKVINLCVSDGNPYEEDSGNRTSQTNGKITSSQALSVPATNARARSTPVADEKAAHAIVARILQFKRETNLRPSSELTPGDFRHGAWVLIGGVNNPWVPILLSSLRYSIQIDPVTMDRWVQDAQNPLRRDWKIPGRQQAISNFADYALVTRYFDAETSQWTMAVCGLGAAGTEAASELLTDPAFEKLLPAGIDSKGNFQIVLRTSVVNGRTGPFQVLAYYLW